MLFFRFVFGFCSVYGPDRWIVEPVFLELSIEEESVVYLNRTVFGFDPTPVLLDIPSMPVTVYP